MVGNKSTMTLLKHEPWKVMSLVDVKQGEAACLSEDRGQHAWLDLLQKVSDWMPGFVFQYRMHPDGSSCFSFASETIRQIYRISPKEVCEDASKVFSVFHPDDLEGVFDSIQASARDLTAWRHEYRVKFDDGSVNWLLGHAMPQCEADGSMLWHGVILDITERKLAEAELRIAAIAFESQEGALITDAHGEILRVNHAFTRITGYSADEVIGHNPRILKSGRHDVAFYAAMWECLDHKGIWKGEIWNRRKGGEVYPEHLCITAVKDNKNGVTHYVATFSDITLRKASEDEVRHLAFYDPLTRLPNRRLLIDRLGQALIAHARNGKEGALLFIDLDNFKMLNDTLGHDVGDLLLQKVSERLSACLREGDTVARFGGDEFVVMLEGLSEQLFEAVKQAELIAHKILAGINQRYALNAHECRSTSSIGVTLFDGSQSGIDELLKQADIAMYQAKKMGGNTFRFFNPQMQENINARAELEADLRIALQENQFRLFYQLQVTHDHRIVGAEALIRWRRPGRGLVAPMEFIPLAEETGLILPIGYWVLETACAQIKKWEKLPQARNLQLAVNVSALQFHQDDFVMQVYQIISQSGIKPSRLKLELTESIVLQSVEQTVQKIIELQKIGVRFSIDDFGTGHSSLTYLTQLPIDQLKIDQSFIRNIAIKPSDSVIVQTIINMANNLGVEIIAEGVETEAQRVFLEKNGCPVCQGYLFSKPVTLEAFELLIGSGCTHSLTQNLKYL